MHQTVYLKNYGVREPLITDVDISTRNPLRGLKCPRGTFKYTEIQAFTVNQRHTDATADYVSPDHLQELVNVRLLYLHGTHRRYECRLARQAYRSLISQGLSLTCQGSRQSELHAGARFPHTRQNPFSPQCVEVYTRLLGMLHPSMPLPRTRLLPPWPYCSRRRSAEVFGDLCPRPPHLPPKQGAAGRLQHGP